MIVAGGIFWLNINGIRSKIKPTKPSQEHFRTSLTSDAMEDLIREAGVESCDILRQDVSAPNMNPSSVSHMQMTLDAMRINKWKPVSVEERSIMQTNQDKEYCYMYNDNRANIQDYRLDNEQNDGCSMNNVLFQNNPMFTQVFTSSNLDNVHKFPITKCVLEIDRKKAAANQGSNVSAFWNVWGPTYCDALAAPLLRQIADLDKKTLEVSKTYDEWLNSNQQLSCSYSSLSNYLHLQCTPCNVVWNSKYQRIQNEYIRLSDVLEDHVIHNQMYSRSNKDLYQKVKGYESNITEQRGIFVVEQDKRKQCDKELAACRKEESKLKKDFDKFQPQVNYKELHVNEIQGIMENKTLVFKDWDEVQNPKCITELESITKKRDEQKVRTDIVIDEYHKCIPERITASNDYKAAFDAFEVNSNLRYRCEERERELDSMYKATSNDARGCIANLPRLKERQVDVQNNVGVQNNALTEAKTFFETVEDDIKACNRTRSKNIKVIGKLLDDNVELYNKYEVAWTQLPGMDIAYVTDQLRQVREMADKTNRDHIDESAALATNVCSIKNGYAAEINSINNQIADARLYLEMLKKVDCSKCVASEKFCVDTFKDNPNLCIAKLPRPSEFQQGKLSVVNRWA